MAQGPADSQVGAEVSKPAAAACTHRTQKADTHPLSLCVCLSRAPAFHTHTTTTQPFVQARAAGLPQLQEQQPQRLGAESVGAGPRAGQHGAHAGGASEGALRLQVGCSVEADVCCGVCVQVPARAHAARSSFAPNAVTLFMLACLCLPESTC